MFECAVKFIKRIHSKSQSWQDSSVLKHFLNEQKDLTLSPRAHIKTSKQPYMFKTVLSSQPSHFKIPGQ